MEGPLIQQGDDALFAAAAPSIDVADGGADDADLLIAFAAIEEKYADKLQLQEVLVAVVESEYIDPKGKAKVKSESPSSSRDHSKTKNCSICMEDKPVADFFEIGQCAHEFCGECVGRYVAVKVEENLASIGCPEAGCGVRMEMEMCQEILRPEVFERWGLAMCELMVENRFYCPFNDCSAMMMVDDDDGGEVIRASECPYCNRLFCAQCKVAWHGDIKCSEFQTLGNGEREREDLLLRNVAKDCKWQRCHKCGFYVERIDGCRLIKCRCGHGFCYSCGSPMGDDHCCIKCRG